MALTINVNTLSLCHRGSGGISTATLPDVCKTPSPGGPVPVPYPNIARSLDLRNGTQTVMVDGGNPAAVKGSEFAISTGDEPGTLGGVKSGTFKKEATWITYSMDVAMEGRNACRLTDKMFHNHSNTVNMGGLLQGSILTHTEVLAELQELCDIQCVTASQWDAAALLWAQDDAMGNGSTIKAEVPFNMSTLKPYMSDNNPVRATRNVFIGGSRRPDVVITDGGPPYLENMRGLVEMKRRYEQYLPGQRDAYTAIATAADVPFIEMREGVDCICEPEPKLQPEVVPEPVTVPAPSFDFKRVGYAALGTVAALGAVAGLIFVFDGPASETAAASVSIWAFSQAFP